MQWEKGILPLLLIFYKSLEVKTIQAKAEVTCATLGKIYALC